MVKGVNLGAASLFGSLIFNVQIGHYLTGGCILDASDRIPVVAHEYGKLPKI